MKHNIYFLFFMLVLNFVAGSAVAQSEAGEKVIGSKEMTVSMYPIPTTGILHFGFNKTIMEEPVVLVYDMIGNPVDQIAIERLNPTTFFVNLSGKKPGFYFVKITADHFNFSRRITVNP